jgi:hypothetical protein
MMHAMWEEGRTVPFAEKQFPLGHKLKLSPSRFFGNAPESDIRAQ